MSTRLTKVEQYLKYGPREWAFPKSLPVVTSPLPVMTGQEQVEWHAANKSEAVSKLFLIAAKMNQRDLFPIPHTQRIVTASRARVQLQKGSRNEKTEAAHCLPAQINVNSMPIYSFVPSKQPMLLYDLRGLCGRTDIVDKEVNYIDSRLEDNGGIDRVVRKVQRMLARQMAEDKLDVGDLQAEYQGYVHEMLMVHDDVMHHLEKEKAKKILPADLWDTRMELLYGSRKTFAETWPEFAETWRIERFSDDFDGELDEGVPFPLVPLGKTGDYY
jgi:hypothetical protein